MEAVQVTASVLKLLDPAFGLGDHHVAVEGAAAVGGGRRGNMRADLGDDRCAKGYVGDEVAVPRG